MLVKNLRTIAIFGSGLSLDAFLQVRGIYIRELSAERQATARRCFKGKFTPGRVS